MVGKKNELLEKAHKLFRLMIKDGLYVQIISSAKESGDHFYYLKVYKVVEYCDLCYRNGPKHRFPCRTEIRQESLHYQIYNDLDDLAEELVDIYKEEKKKGLV